MYPEYLKYSTDVTGYYDLTYKQAIIFIESRRKAIQEQALLQARLDYTNTEHLSTNIARMLGNSTPVRGFEDLYSYLIDSDIRERIDEAKKAVAKQQAIAQFEAWANAYNNRKGVV